MFLNFNYSYYQCFEKQWIVVIILVFVMKKICHQHHYISQHQKGPFTNYIGNHGEGLLDKCQRHYTHWLIRNKVFCFDHHWQHKQMSHQKSQFCWTWSVMIYLGLLDNSWVLSGIAIQSNIFEAICLKLLQWFYILATHGPLVIVFFEFVKKLGVRDLNN